MKTWKRFIPLLLCLIICLLATQNFRLIVTQGTSMEPTYLSGDLLLVARNTRDLQPGDAVLIRHQGILMIKRLCAVADQRAITPAVPDESGSISIGTDMDAGATTVSKTDAGQPLPAWADQYWPGYLDSDGITYYHYWSDSTDATVPEGYVFVVGDNLGTSYDSRYKDFGLVQEDQILGRVLFGT